MQMTNDTKQTGKLEKTSVRSAKTRTFLLLHLLLIIYSASAVCSKLASSQKFLSAPFLLFYAGTLLSLVIYAVGWQQILRKMPLTTAFANKSVVFLWAFLWGMLFFREKLSLGMCIGAVLVIIGILLVVSDHG